MSVLAVAFDIAVPISFPKLNPNDTAAVTASIFNAKGVAMPNVLAAINAKIGVKNALVRILSELKNLNVAAVNVSPTKILPNVIFLPLRAVVIAFPTPANLSPTNNAAIADSIGALSTIPFIAFAIAFNNSFANFPISHATFLKSIEEINSPIASPTFCHFTFFNAVVIVVTIPLIPLDIDFPSSCHPLRPVFLFILFIFEIKSLIP